MIAAYNHRIGTIDTLAGESIKRPRSAACCNPTSRAEAGPMLEGYTMAKSNRTTKPPPPLRITDTHEPDVEAMRRYPVIDAARAQVDRLLAGAQVAFTIHGDDGTITGCLDRELRPILPRFLTDAATAIDHGFAAFEWVYQVRSGRLVFDRLKLLHHADVAALVDPDTGAFAGLRFSGVELDTRKLAWVSIGGDPADPVSYGRSLLERVRPLFRRKLAGESVTDDELRRAYMGDGSPADLAALLIEPCRRELQRMVDALIVLNWGNAAGRSVVSIELPKADVPGDDPAERWRLAEWFDDVTRGQLSPDRLRAARRDGRLKRSKRAGRRWSDNVDEVMDLWPGEIANRIRAEIERLKADETGEVAS